MFTKIRIKDGKKFIYGKWYFGGAELSVDLENTNIKNQKNSYDIVDANNEVVESAKRKYNKKAINTKTIKNRMMDTIENK